MPASGFAGAAEGGGITIPGIPPIPDIPLFTPIPIKPAGSNGFDICGGGPIIPDGGKDPCLWGVC